MKTNQYLLFVIVSILFASTYAIAQPKITLPSPKAEAMQTVGVSDIRIKYSSPAVRGREIWGKKLRYGGPEPIDLPVFLLVPM